MEYSKTGNGAHQKRFTCNKFHWRPEEDEKLTSLVQKIGPNNWELIAKQFRGRTGKSCRLRWVNQLDPDIVKAPFTVEEKRKLLELHQFYGNKWAVISKHFDRRTDNQVKNQYHVLVGSRTIRASSPPSGDNLEDTPKEESMNLSLLENVSTMASGSQFSKFSYDKDSNAGFDPSSVVTPYRVEIPFIHNGPYSVYGKDEMWYGASGSNPGMADPHSFENANLGYINSDQHTFWDDAMNSDISYTELLNLPVETPPQQGYVKDHQFIDFFGIEKP
ncbi:transcriptional activator Myb-like [Dorcoceras hygrometricum]|uniref:Transcriptional activator Myb-like n=1 Tax=Dorcoceras hygrometricum TaxID=472368 RepID=A0A2Z7D2U0_9LAMI|nr:transcriptional activator Myb-like [Dorcoceras hygrometricum]